MKKLQRLLIISFCIVIFSTLYLSGCRIIEITKKVEGRSVRIGFGIIPGYNRFLSGGSVKAYICVPGEFKKTFLKLGDEIYVRYHIKSVDEESNIANVSLTCEDGSKKEIYIPLGGVWVDTGCKTSEGRTIYVKVKNNGVR
ncbi:MAG: hypothetical protein JSV88_05740 [Candidatus Aminicenantes bacterium]|nr:MAG: hypothetical protein JSV88_05740 [Candidatus Aminicenantes bacterium]